MCFRCLWNSSATESQIISPSFDKPSNPDSLAVPLAFDGERSDLSLVNALFDYLVSGVSNEVHLPLHALTPGFDGILRVENPPHSTTDRCRRICDPQQCADLTSASTTLDRDAFPSLGMLDSELKPAPLFKIGHELPLILVSVKFLPASHAQQREDSFSPSCHLPCY
jgi:hypothetical protein